MAVSYQGKKPGKLWYVSKRLGLILKALRNKDTKIDAQIMAGDVGITTALVAGGIALLSVPQLALIPFGTWAVGSIAGGGAAFYGVKSWLGLRRLNNSTFAYYHMKDAEAAWLEKKQRAPWLTRLRASITRGLDRVGAALMSPLKIFKRKAVVKKTAATAMTYTEDQTAKSPDGALADSFATAQAPAPSAEDRAAEAARQARAAVRAQRKANGGKRLS